MTNNTIKTEAILKQDGKFEFLYLKGVPVYFANILEPSEKYQSTDLEYQMTVFVDTETREKLELLQEEGGINVNKELKEVGVDKNKKKKIKYLLSSQLKEGEKGTTYDDMEGLHGMSLSVNELTKAGKKSMMKVVDAEGKDWDKSKSIGNGSIVNVKCFGYRNQDEQLVVSLNAVVVVEHVPYEGGSGGMVEDDILGVTMDMSASFEASETSGKASAEDIKNAANKDEANEGFGFDEEIPF